MTALLLSLFVVPAAYRLLRRRQCVHSESPGIRRVEA
jgi:hypothetical protein